MQLTFTCDVIFGLVEIKLQMVFIFSGIHCFFVTLKSDTKNKSHQNFRTDRTFTSISTVFHDSKVKPLLHISPKSEAFAIKTLHLREVQSWMTTLTVKSAICYVLNYVFGPCFKMTENHRVFEIH